MIFEKKPWETTVLTPYNSTERSQSVRRQENRKTVDTQGIQKSLHTKNLLSSFLVVDKNDPTPKKLEDATRTNQEIKFFLIFFCRLAILST